MDECLMCMENINNSKDCLINAINCNADPKHIMCNACLLQLNIYSTDYTKQNMCICCSGARIDSSLPLETKYQLRKCDRCIKINNNDLNELGIYYICNSCSINNIIKNYQLFFNVINIKIFCSKCEKITKHCLGVDKDPINPLDAHFGLMDPVSEMYNTNYICVDCYQKTNVMEQVNTLTINNNIDITSKCIRCKKMTKLIIININHIIYCVCNICSYHLPIYNYITETDEMCSMCNYNKLLSGQTTCKKCYNKCIEYAFNHTNLIHNQTSKVLPLTSICINMCKDFSRCRICKYVNSDKRDYNITNKIMCNRCKALKDDNLFCEECVKILRKNINNNSPLRLKIKHRKYCNVHINQHECCIL